MSMEGRKPYSPEMPANVISDKLIEKLGTSDIPFAYRTANNSIYVSDRRLRTVRYKAADKSFQPPSVMTVYLEDKYLTYSAYKAAGDVEGSEYLGNTLLNKEGMLILNDPELLKQKKALVRSLDDIPADMEAKAIKKALSIVIFDPVAMKTVRKTPVSLVPQVGHHPVEFWSQRDSRGYDKHIGNAIENLSVTNRNSEEEIRAAIGSLVAISIENIKNQPPPPSLDDLSVYLDE